VPRLDAFVSNLNPHSEREEGTLIPLMVKYIGRETGPIAVMEFEHDMAKQNLKHYCEVAAQLQGAVATARWESGSR